MPYDFQELTLLSERQLRALWLRGSAPDAGQLAGRVFRGRNTAPAARLGPGGGAFAKGFVHVGDAVAGCNFPVAAAAGGWRLDSSKPYGFFHVLPTAGAPRGDGPASGLLLDYGRGQASEFRRRGAPVPGMRLRLTELLARPLRDVLVQPPDGASGILIGRAFFGARLSLPLTFFILEPWQPLTAAWAADHPDRVRPHPPRVLPGQGRS